MTHDPREFSCMDDHDNDGWGNSTIDPLRPPRYPDEENEREDRETDFWANLDGDGENLTKNVQNNGSMNCTNPDTP